MRIFSAWIVFAVFIMGQSEGDSVTQSQSSESRREGEAVTIKCTYSTTGNYYLYWYRQKAEKAPQFVVRRWSGGTEEKKGEGFGTRFSAVLQTSTKLTSLTIAGLQLTDAAVYYCALSDYYGTRKLHFGSGTKLIVEPKDKAPEEPTLSVFYPPVVQQHGEASVTTAAVCLASKFSPKGIELFMEADTVQSTNVTASSLLLDSGYYTSSGMLIYTQPNQPANVTCVAHHQNKVFRAESEPQKPEVDPVKPLYCGKHHVDSMKDRLRVNSLSLTVLGLRLLFFKTVAFNVLMTARVWLF
uniref:T cell receptor alpha chain MC.7.G5-like n=1 Tax=Pristiophorus japonicus TaxID=55135 RepID=UPI00398F1F4D